MRRVPLSGRTRWLSCNNCMTSAVALERRYCIASGRAKPRGHPEAGGRAAACGKSPLPPPCCCCNAKRTGYRPAKGGIAMVIRGAPQRVCWQIGLWALLVDFFFSLHLIFFRATTVLSFVLSARQTENFVFGARKI